MATVVGQVLNDRYEILEKVGEGGMAIAYRGRDRVLGRVVAIKVMRPELATDAAFLARFRREARAAAGGCASSSCSRARTARAPASISAHSSW